MWPWIAGGTVFVIVCYLSAMPESPEAKAKALARRVIDQCWSDQQRKSLDPSDQRVMAGWCEDFERKFVQKYGHNP